MYVCICARGVQFATCTGFYNIITPRLSMNGESPDGRINTDSVSTSHVNCAGTMGMSEDSEPLTFLLPQNGIVLETS